MKRREQKHLSADKREAELDATTEQEESNEIQVARNQADRDDKLAKLAHQHEKEAEDKYRKAEEAIKKLQKALGIANKKEHSSKEHKKAADDKEKTEKDQFQREMELKNKQFKK